MNNRRALFLVLVLLGRPAFAHRLNEYLQATIFSVEKDRIDASMRLVPGVAVYPAVIASIDSNHDGIVSSAEGQTYAQQVLRDLNVTVDGRPAVPRLLSANFPTIQDMKEGLGEIQIAFRVDLPSGRFSRELIVENHHQSGIAAYLVNCLMPRDPAIKVIEQYRNANQSFYRLDFTQGDAAPAPPTWWSTVSLGTSVGFGSLFRLGLQHIAEGTDHLLFLLVLLLPAPLMVLQRHWTGCAGVRDTLLRICKVVTAFTIGHSITLALGAWGLVRVPSRPIEVLIAFSIFISAVHAIHPLFPGREAWIAVFFGLIHGLAFAATLGQLGFGRWQRVTGILGFNLGIETMQLIVIAATMPSLLLLSRTRAYPFFRIGGAVFAGLAAVGWIAERAFGLSLPVDTIVNLVAHRAIYFALVLFVISLIFRSFKPRAIATRSPQAAPHGRCQEG